MRNLFTEQEETIEEMEMTEETIRIINGLEAVRRLYAKDAEEYDYEEFLRYFRCEEVEIHNWKYTYYSKKSIVEDGKEKSRVLQFIKRLLKEFVKNLVFEVVIKWIKLMIFGYSDVEYLYT